ncbi:DUF2336 domain-containing protein [Chelatococcus sp. GCM10030263]|uniref:DUF2336 domain-containing protein n=1 Tax=Chelatococcus sp. GCM10030263 TaxID=3273387 RepID=UPI003614643A
MTELLSTGLPKLADDFSSLADLARGGVGDLRPVLLRAQTELFLSASSHSPEAKADFEMLATALIGVVDTATLIQIAERLAPHPDTPRGILTALHAAGGEACAIVLASARDINPDWIMAATVGSDPRHASAVAGRTDLTPWHVELLIDRNEAEVDEALAANPAAVISRPALDMLLGRARTRPELARLLVARADLTGMDKAPLFGYATREQRAAILDEVEGFVALEGRRRTAAFLEAAARDRAIGAAACGDRLSFAEVLAQALGVSPEEALPLCTDPLGELLALALVAVGIDETDAIRIFLTLDPVIAQSVERVFSLAALVRSVSRETASRVTSAVVGHDIATPRRTGQHVPALAPSGTGARPVPRQENAAEQPAERSRNRQTG